MQLKKVIVKDVTCDIGVCKNPAVYAVTDEGVSTENELRLCAVCAKKLRDILNGRFKNGSERENGNV